jgi:hypothetical protein
MTSQETTSPQVASSTQPSMKKQPWTKPTLTEISLGDAEAKQPKMKSPAKHEHHINTGFATLHYGPVS